MPEPGGWHHPSVAQQQHDLAMGEMRKWQRGELQHFGFQYARELLNHAQPTGVLEVGCGAGYYARIVLDATMGEASYIGLDYSEPMIELARQIYPSLRWELADQRDLPVGNDAWDMVMNGAALLHLMDGDDWLLTLREAKRVAKRWVFLHRVPVRTQPFKASKTIEKDAYGTLIRERHVGQRELLQQLAMLKLRIVATRRWNTGGDPEQWSLLLQVPREE